MPGGDKTGSHACVTFVPMKPKVVLLCKVYFVFKILFNKNSFCLVYTRKNYELLKTGLNNVVLPILLIVVNNIEQVVEPESSPQSGVTMLNNIVDIIEQCGQHNIVPSCLQQPVTTYNFWLCNSVVNFDT